MRTVLILTDGKAGHENQSRSFARALGCSFEVVRIGFKSRFFKALSYLFDHLGILTDALLTPLPPLESKRYAAVIGTGSGTFYAAKTLARRWGVRCGVVLYPRGYRLSTFDCVLAPAFDQPALAPQVIKVPANLVAADTAFYAQGVKAFRAHYQQQCGQDFSPNAPRPVAVIIGGPNRCSTMSVEWMKQQLDALFAEPVSPGTEFWVTTSRRTPPEIEALIAQYPWQYCLLYSRDHFNPIPAFVTLAGQLYVTAESTGMLSEACTAGTARVVALDNLRPGRHKFRRFVEGLEAEGYLKGARKIDLSASFAAAARLLALK